MSPARTIVTIACFFLFVTEGIAGDIHDFEPRFISEPAISIELSSSEFFPARVHYFGSIRIGGGFDISPRLGLEACAGIGGTSGSRLSGTSYYVGYSGAFGSLNMLGKINSFWGVTAGPRFSWMTLSDTGHGFFFPSGVAGLFVNLPPRKNDTWYLRLSLIYAQHFRKDLVYSSSTGIGLSFVQPLGGVK